MKQESGFLMNYSGCVSTETESFTLSDAYDQFFLTNKFKENTIFKNANTYFTFFEQKAKVLAAL